MLLKIAVADVDSEYVERFAAALEDNAEIMLSTYTDEDALRKDLKIKKYDIFLFDPEIYQGQFDIGKNVTCVMLFDDTKDIPATCTDYVKVNKYQRVSKTYKQVLELYSSMTGSQGTVLGQNRAKIIAVYSPIGGAGSTTFALAIAHKYASIGFRSFYMNFEDLSSEGFYLPQDLEHGMSDVAMHLGDNIDISVKLKSLIQPKIENFYYLKHFDSPNDIYALSDDDVTELIESIASSGLFDYLIVDMGTAVNGQSLRIFEASDRILLIEKTDRVSLMKMQSFVSQMHIMNSFAPKMLRVINFSTGAGSQLKVNIPVVGGMSVMQNPDPSQLVEWISMKSCEGIVAAV